MAKRFGLMSALGMCAFSCLGVQAGERDIRVEIVDSHGTAFQQVPRRKPSPRPRRD